jgi:hypothetical protein
MRQLFPTTYLDRRMHDRKSDSDGRCDLLGAHPNELPLGQSGIVNASAFVWRLYHLGPPGPGGFCLAPITKQTVEQNWNAAQEGKMVRERDLEIPSDQITGRELRDWHVVTIACGHCYHGRVVDHRLLKRGERGTKPLSKLHWRCEWCKKTSGEVQHIVRVVRLPRNI